MKILTLSLAAMLLAAGCGAAAATSSSGTAKGGTTTGTKPASSGPAHVTMAWVAITGSQAPAWITYDGGYFKKNNVDVNLQYIQGSVTAAAAMVGGSVQFVTMAGPAVVAADNKGANQVMIMGFVNKPAFYVMTAKNITSPTQLEGKTVAVTKVGNSDDFMLRDALKYWKLKTGTTGSDVRVVGAGSVAGQVAAFQKGLVQALVVDPPNNVLAGKAGAHVLANIADLGIAYQANGLVTTQPYLQQHPNVVENVVKSFIQGLQRFKTDKAYAEKVMSKYLKTSNAAVVDASYNAFAPLFPEVPVPTKTGMRAIAQQLQAKLKGKTIHVSRMIDPSFVDKLQQSGFIKQVYGS